ncbi:hypothetical protein [Chryseobacterium salviniae]|jgi:hypothetical protein|uniref:Histidine Kinase domain-containing protein n=1 Tax=Chryseobacterium salviniae TaxID=3101750 RepID=A0ABU6HTV4_9FLAO|nr:hypothetical protein [Chryseobacterium sp. T9W2-O]MEC3876484.1 hypothetical protein [Chryseobacterium sp. T9W2-O]
MPKDKYDFISELLNNKKITSTQREQIFRLSSEEIKKDKNSGLKLEQRIHDIEEKLKYFNLQEITQIENPTSVIKSSDIHLPKYINPFSQNGLTNFLIAYNQDPILKYTCHTIDSQNIFDDILDKCGTNKYNLELHRKLIEESYIKLSNNYHITYQVKNLISAYLTGKDFSGNTSNWATNMNINWASEEIKNWSEKNPNIVPNPGGALTKEVKSKGFKLPSPIASNLTDRKMNYFSDIVIYFKSLFHIKADNSLNEIVKNYNKKNYGNTDIKFIIEDVKFQKSIELFTDVDKLLQGYKKIIEMIIQVVYKHKLPPPLIELSFTQNPQSVDFIIHHINVDYYRKTIKDIRTRIGDSYSDLIKNQINGLCDLYLNAKFENGSCYQINLWNSFKTRDAYPIEEIEGVQYILRFK